MISKLRQMYRDDPNPGVHGAAEWTLRQWGWADEIKRIDKELETGNILGDRQWYVNRQGQTMLVVQGPLRFRMGTQLQPRSQADEVLHTRRIEHSFAIATKEVTVRQFRAFRKEFPWDSLHLRAPKDDCPINSVTWYDAAAYCNWLSKQEGIPEDQWCYLPNQAGEFAQGMKLAPEYLTRTGYRLPTEPEWEYACRAGAFTIRHYGHSEELLEKYSLHKANSEGYISPVGSLKPNDLGMFDMHGNVDEWCQERYLQYPSLDWEGRGEPGDWEGAGVVADGVPRVRRVGSYTDPPHWVRSANRAWGVPKWRAPDNGFRVGRTMP